MMIAAVAGFVTSCSTIPLPDVPSLTERRFTISAPTTAERVRVAELVKQTAAKYKLIQAANNIYGYGSFRLAYATQGNQLVVVLSAERGVNESSTKLDRFDEIGDGLLQDLKKTFGDRRVESQEKTSYRPSMI